MQIYREIYENIISNLPERPPEIGGILGKNSDNIICKTVVDRGMENRFKQCSYVPNVDKLNGQIKDWEKQDIEFVGIFHTHFWGVETLSYGDKKYIIEIMSTMPKEIKYLYFPIVVIPERKIVPYIAYIENEKVTIKGENIEIID